MQLRIGRLHLPTRRPPTMLCWRLEPTLSTPRLSSVPSSCPMPNFQWVEFSTFARAMLLRGLLRNCGDAGAAITSPAWHSSYKAAAATAGAVADRGMRIASAPQSPAPTPNPSSAHVTADGGPAIEGIPLAEYAARRRQLMGMLPPNSVAVIPAAPTV